MERVCKKCGVGVSGMEDGYVLSGVWWGGCAERVGLARGEGVTCKECQVSTQGEL